MKRAAALRGLSHDHHHELVQARRLLRAAGEEPEGRLGVARAYVDAFFTETVEHFRREEEVLFPAYTRRGGASPVLQHVLLEHMQLHGLARALQAEVAGGEVAPASTRALGELLRAHVRLEERELFADIERVVPPEELAALDLG